MTIRALFTDRHGGVSASPYDTLNFAYHVGDNPAAVKKNRTLLKKRIKAERIVWMEQIHGDTIHIVRKNGPETLPACDALVTDTPGIALAVMVADCIPLLLIDRERGVIAAVHAGRNGTFLHIAAKTVATMHETFGCDPAHIHAILGPSIGPCCYEIGEDLAAIVEKTFGKGYMNSRYLDLQSLNTDQLIAAGIDCNNIEASGICTCCSGDHYSYRRDGTTGRFAGVVWIEQV